MSSERTHRHAHARTRPPRDRGGRCAVSFLPALASPPPPFFKSSTEPFLPSFMYAVLSTEELGKHFRGASRGERDWTQDARREDAWAAGLCSVPCPGPEGGKVSAALGPTGELAAPNTSNPPPPPNCNVKSPPEFTSDSGRVGCIASGRVSGSTSGCPCTGKCAVSLWWLLLLGPRGARAARVPHPCTAWKAGGGPGARAPRGAAWRRRRVGRSCTFRLPSETASTEPGRPLAFHYPAYESSSPGKYVAIKINRPALSAEHNANYLWAVCAIFIIVQAPGASCLPASPARPARAG